MAAIATNEQAFRLTRFSIRWWSARIRENAGIQAAMRMDNGTFLQILLGETPTPDDLTAFRAALDAEFPDPAPSP